MSTSHPTGHTVDCLLLTHKDNKYKDTLTTCQDDITSVKISLYRKKIEKIYDKSKFKRILRSVLVGDKMREEFSKPGNSWKWDVF